MAIHHLTAEDFDTVTAAGRCLVDFWAVWCGPCRMQASVIDEFREAHPDDVKVCKVDVDAQPALARRFGIMSIPTILYYQDGRQTGKVVGVQSLAQLEAGLGL